MSDPSNWKNRLASLSDGDSGNFGIEIASRIRQERFEDLGLAARRDDPEVWRFGLHLRFKEPPSSWNFSQDGYPGHWKLLRKAI